MNYNHISLIECKPRWVYRIHSRNLLFGVFNPIDNGFIGIREKFDQLYLFTEYHYDTGAPFGTVSPAEALEEIPKDIIVAEDLGITDHITGRLIKFDKPISDGGKGWYFLDSGESDKNIRPVENCNKKLFDYLKELENKYSELL